MLKFLTMGRWGPGRVRTAWVPDGRKRLSRIDHLIESAWAEASARPAVHLFDGPMCRLESFAPTPQSLDLSLSPTSYKVFLGTNMNHPELAQTYGREVLANPLGLSVGLVTADDFLLLGRRNTSVAYYPGRVHPFAGALEPRDASAPDGVFAGARRELAEELSLTDADLDPGALQCLGIMEDAALLQQELAFTARCRLNRAGVESRLDRVEHDAIVAIPPDVKAVGEILENTSEFTPVAVGTLMLWGRESFGPEWFDTFVV